MQDLLLRFGVKSNLAKDRIYYKTLITGFDNISLFNKHIGFVSSRKNKIVIDYLQKTDRQIIRTVKDIIPNCQELIISLLEKYHISNVGKNNITTMRHDYLKRRKNIARKHLQKMVTILKGIILPEDMENLIRLENYAFSEIGFAKIKNVDKIKNIDQKWTYDITVEPHHNFISQNMILHNTVSIAKANIQATLRCETTVLAAANPKFGRFDPYETVAKQIDLPPALINRFDLIFTIKDIPNEERDERMAKFILTMHKEKLTEEPEVATEFLRKYLIYSRQKMHPILTDSALDELKDHYVRMRSSGTSEDGGMNAVPISARPLEALVRLSEATAKLRLSTKITKKDAQRAISILMYCLEQVGMDPETGKIDIDRITSGITTSERNKINVVKEIINQLEVQFGKMIPIEEIIKAAAEKNLDSEKVEESIEKLKRTGDLFEPKPGKVQKI